MAEILREKNHKHEAFIKIFFLYILSFGPKESNREIVHPYLWISGPHQNFPSTWATLTEKINKNDQKVLQKCYIGSYAPDEEHGLPLRWGRPSDHGIHQKGKERI